MASPSRPPKKSPSAKTKKQSSAEQSSPHKWWGKKGIYFLLKLALVSTICLVFYGIYLDAKVRDTFEGQRWQVPIQVFGKTPVYSRGDPLSISQLTRYLKLSHYHKVTKVSNPGEYAVSSKRVIIYRRAITPHIAKSTPDPLKITIDVTKGKISEIYHDNTPADTAVLEPILIDRIVPKSNEDRVITPLQEIPEQLIDTLLLVEDRDFYFHKGISPLGILRALYANIVAGRTVQGGSTLTQQLVKNMYLTRDKTIWRKVNEALMSLILEYRYSKDQLLEAYMNEVYLGQHYANGIYGFGLAADFYFGNSINQLSASQMALLVAQVKGPSYYDPWRYPERALERRNLVLKLMFQAHIIEREEYQFAVNSELTVRENRRISKQKYPDYIQLVKQELRDNLPQDALLSGIKVFTGFDVIAQQKLTQTLDSSLQTLEKEREQTDLQAAMIVTDFNTGEIVALSGGKSLGYAGFNRALAAKRQIGSLIKPVIFAAALERYQQYNYGTILADKPLVLVSDSGQEWRPNNYDDKFRGQVSLFDALIYSLNVPTVNLGMTLGLENVASALASFGYQLDASELRPSMLLGALNMTPYEINQVYVTLATQGVYRQTHAVKKVISSYGETLYQHRSNEAVILSSQAGQLVDYGLQQVTKQGSARALTWRVKGVNLAGKTGTTNDQRDTWFIGYDNRYLVTTWLGKDDNQPTNLTGSSGALVLFSEFIKRLGAQSLPTQYRDDVAYAWFDNKDGTLLAKKCDNSSQYLAFKASVAKGLNCSKTTVAESEEQPKKKSWFERLFGKKDGE
ncbi:penicillin-binding protein 1B [Thalassotalea sp. LPB0316]|uniref:penicillin-binding protein 1B n=1 Tax=Thalassotalea sp. LPB0316 TaxID=2769490 RepID=UPI001867C735|nr:penicillin-binding protein 1B [Thalassotalea sp. LPB0316]QOL26710.1 penicillin-binding protein 1B [Thalassotalea sp. LPB0316]